MFGRHRLLLLIPAIILISLILGMPPLNMGYRLASGGPLTHCKQVQLNNRCLFHSITSHADPFFLNLDLTSLGQESMPSFNIQVLDPDSIHSDITFNPYPLRC